MFISIQGNTNITAAEKLLAQVDLCCYYMYMKILQSAKAKAQFSAVLRDVQAGNEVAISYGKQQQTIAVIIPYDKWKKKEKRQLGTLEGKASVTFADDFKMTDEELIN